MTMTDNPLISIIMNCYNGEKYLQEALDSVINQTYKNWEIIFWDNQSTDNSSFILKSYKDHRIKYFYSIVKGMRLPVQHPPSKLEKKEAFSYPNRGIHSPQ